MDDVTDIHMVSFHDDFITSLGRSFVRDVYYKYMIKSGTAVGIVCEVKGRAIGFVVGAYGSKKLYSELLRRFWFKITVSFFITFLKSPNILLSILRTLLVMRDNYGSFEEESELYQIAVADEYLGKGVGGMLVDVFLRTLCNAGVHRCWTKTHSQQAASFYKKNGFYQVSSFILHDKTNFVFARKIGRPCN